MTDLNVAIRFNPESEGNPGVHDLTEELGRKDNAAFLAEVARRLREASEKSGPGGTRIDPGGVAAIGLMGEYGLIGYGIRRAQELIRLDRMPSYWSHAFLLTGALSEDPAVNRSSRRSAWLLESTLEPSGGLSHFTLRNGVAPRRIGDYSRATFSLLVPHCVPNMAIVAIGLTEEERKAVLARADSPDADQLRYDVAGLLGAWYAYLTKRAAEPNPLSQGNALFCSAYVQFAYDAAQIDLAPGAHQRNTSPEHIWQAVKHLHATFRVEDPETGKREARRVLAWTVLRDRACVVAPIDAKLPRRPSELMGEEE